MAEQGEYAGRALISVFDKTDIVLFAGGLHELDMEVVSSGGTATEIAAAGIPVTPVEEITGFPSVLGGRVKTLHPHIHMGILANLDKPEDVATLKEYGVMPFDLVCVDMYPLKATIETEGVTFAEIIEKIDIGGPTMLAGAAKAGRLALSKAEQRPRVLQWLRDDRPEEAAFVADLQREAFEVVGAYYQPFVDYLGRLAAEA